MALCNGSKSAFEGTQKLRNNVPPKTVYKN